MDREKSHRLEIVKAFPGLQQEEAVQKPREQMTEERKQREFIFKTFSQHKGEIDNTVQEARRAHQKTFTLVLKLDITNNGLISRDRVADILRQWVFETYGHSLGLERFDHLRNQVQLRCEEEKLDEYE